MTPHKMTTQISAKCLRWKLINTEKDVQIALGTYLPKVWAERRTLHNEGWRLCDKGLKFYNEGNKLKGNGGKLIAEGSKLYNEGYVLCAESNNLFINAVIEVYGKNIITWTRYGCKLDNGLEFRYDG